MGAEPFAGEERAVSGEATEVPVEAPVEAMSFEAALAELETLVQKLERGQLDLEASIRAYERGTVLRQHCAAKLREVQLRVEKIQERDGALQLQPFEAA